MYALCAFGAVNTQNLAWMFFMRYIYLNFHSFIHSSKRLIVDCCCEMQLKFHLLSSLKDDGDGW